MKIARIGARGHEKPVLIDGDAYYDISPIHRDIDEFSLTTSGLARVRQAHEAGELPLIDVSGQRIGAPIAKPGAIICIGMNYAAHAAESGSLPPEIPIMFLKTPNTVVGPYDEVAIPLGSTKTDWEVELGVVIGERASYLASPADSRRHIAGFVTANDLSERDFQLAQSGGQWSKGKCAPGFNPTGPWLVTTEDVDYGNLRLRSWVNGDPRQDSSTSDLIFDVDTVIWHLSQYLVLDPGDLILTGTPEGVALSGRFPYLSVGDVSEIEIEGLGRQRTPFVETSIVEGSAA